MRSELLTLRERAGELGAIRDQLVQERRLAESLQQRLAVAQQQLVDAREDAARWERGYTSLGGVLRVGLTACSSCLGFCAYVGWGFGTTEAWRVQQQALLQPIGQN